MSKRPLVCWIFGHGAPMRARDADGTLMWVCARCGRTWPRTAYGKAGTSKDDDPNDYDEGFA